MLIRNIRIFLLDLLNVLDIMFIFSKYSKYFIGTIQEKKQPKPIILPYKRNIDKSVSIMISNNAIVAPIVENNPPNPQIINQKLKNSKSYSSLGFF